ncbi:MAG: KUP/HAK/KT family potassium transporter [Candidatus Saccharimonadales bacterium]
MKKRTRNTALAIGALGVVFGDIGTSALYALPAVFVVGQGHISLERNNILGIISMIIWSITLVVTIKYILFIMRADNKGEGGIIALIGLIKHSLINKRTKRFWVALGLLGVALFYGDSLITPAISIMSAVEGINIVAPKLHSVILPLSVVILTILFCVQRYGTNSISRLFGPIMLCWFMAIGLGGLWRVVQYPLVLGAMSPTVAFNFVVQQPLTAFIAMGAVILTLTGAEALYADMGHFGREHIEKAWVYIVFPALLLCYLGQGALLINDPSAMSNPTIYMFPKVFQLPMVVLATFATLIASQAVISGAFSLTRQAVHLGFLPKMTVRHTSVRETGQVYMPFINLLLFIGVLLLVLIFRSSAQLSHAYGMAVSITLAIDTILFIVVMKVIWRKPMLYILAFAPIFLLIDGAFVASNITKVINGGWFPILIATGVIVIITTWMQGKKIISKEQTIREGSLSEYIKKLPTMKPRVNRIPGQAVYIGHHEDLAPLALHVAAEQLNELHQKSVIVSIHVRNIAHVPKAERAEFDPIGNAKDGISHLTLYYGYHDLINIPATLKSLRKLTSELDFDPLTASYFVSLAKVVPTKKSNMAKWRKTLFCLMSNYSANSGDYFKLPTEKTIEIRSLLEL